AKAEDGRFPAEDRGDPEGGRVGPAEATPHGKARVGASAGGVRLQRRPMPSTQSGEGAEGAAEGGVRSSGEPSRRGGGGLRRIPGRDRRETRERARVHDGVAANRRVVHAGVSGGKRGKLLPRPHGGVSVLLRGSQAGRLRQPVLRGEA